MLVMDPSEGMSDWGDGHGGSLCCGYVVLAMVGCLINVTNMWLLIFNNTCGYKSRVKGIDECCHALDVVNAFSNVGATYKRTYGRGININEGFVLYRRWCSVIDWTHNKHVKTLEKYAWCKLIISGYKQF